MRMKFIAALSGVALASVLIVSPPVSADKPAEPAESGVVQRFDTRGGHGVGPVLADVGGEMLPILVIVGWDDAVTYCTDGPPVLNGVEQNVSSPSGNFSIVVHNSDVPILVFDVSDADDENDFFEKCAAGDIVPLAIGTAKQRPIIGFTDRAVNFKVKTRGVVTDLNGQDWTMQAFFKVRDVFGAEEPQVSNEWVTLKAL
jgi:hypothetical protein